MTRRKPAKAHKPITCPACATELPDAFIRSSANALAGRKDRPGAKGLVRNPTGTREKAYQCSNCGDDAMIGFRDDAGKRLCTSCFAAYQIATDAPRL